MAINLFTGLDQVLSDTNFWKTIQPAVVESIEDPQGLGRIKVRISGTALRGGDGNNPEATPVDKLPWCIPLVPKFFTSVPKRGEAVLILTTANDKKYQDRYYIGPLISQLTSLEKDPITTALSILEAGAPGGKNVKIIQPIKGIFPKEDDIAIQGRNNSDVLLRKNEVLIRAGKITKTDATNENPYGIKFNESTQGFIQIRYDVPINPKNTSELGSVLNIVGTKINLISKNGAPSYSTLINPDDQISNTQILEIIKTAHPVPFGDVLLEYLILIKNALLNHVHNGGKATDLIVGGNKQDVEDFKKNASNLERKMLSDNIRIN
jgi:hypothetical protein